MTIKSQLLKGILEGCILAVIAQEKVYGYELSLKLKQYGLEVSEGSIYPILLRLQKEKHIYGKMEKSQSGPNRKYYFLTDQGKEALADFKRQWEGIKIPVDRLLNGRDDEQ